jgi:serine-type D-Ala-D-Ala carboxypeptidase
MEKMKKAKLGILLQEGVSNHVFPGAVLLVVYRQEEVFFEAAGNAALKPNLVSMERLTVFDLASLTKPLATTLAMMKLVDDGAVSLDEPIGALLPGMDTKDKERITLRLLLSHASGLRDWEPFYSRLDEVPLGKRKQQVIEWILDSPLAFSPGSKARYSDLGFMLLEWIIKRKTGRPLDQFVRGEFYQPLGANLFLYDSTRAMPLEQTAFAATEFCPWRKRVLQGEVHDENAYAMGGYAGHAGLFGTAADVGTIGSFLLRCYNGSQEELLRPDTVRTFFSRQQHPRDTTWALGWDTPSRSGSSTGTFFSEECVGHLGFTGTSLWIDLEKQVMVIFLTNRVHPSRENEEIKVFRPMIHDCIMDALGFGRGKDKEKNV